MSEPEEATNASVLGRLLEEISWEGAKVRNYRGGGRGYENVLTAEVLGPLTNLPRPEFLAEVVRAGHGAATTREVVAGEAELADITLLPEQSWLAAGGTVVQPDALMTTPSARVLIEAKGMGRSSFQAEQLSREFACIARDAAGCLPLLLLVLPSPPPVPVKGHGKQSIADAIRLYLGPVVSRTTGLDLSASDLADLIPEAVAWITWGEIRAVVEQVVLDTDGVPASLVASVERLRTDLLRAVDWHSRTG